MLKIIANVLLFLFLTVNAYAGGGAVGLMVATSGSTAAASCSTSTDSTDHDGLVDHTGVTRSAYALVGFGEKFTLTANSTITEYQVCISSNTAGATADIAIYNDNAGTVGTLVTGTKVQITNILKATTWTDCTTNPLKVVTLSTPVALSTGTYWVYVDNASDSNTLGSLKGSGGTASTVDNTTNYGTGANIAIGVWGCTP